MLHRRDRSKRSRSFVEAFADLFASGAFNYGEILDFSLFLWSVSSAVSLYDKSSRGAGTTVPSRPHREFVTPGTTINLSDEKTARAFVNREIVEEAKG